MRRITPSANPPYEPVAEQGSRRVGKGAKRRAHHLAEIASKKTWARFRRRSSSYGGQAALPTLRHHPLRCPSGKTPMRWVNPHARKHSALPKFGFVVLVRYLIPVRGAYRDRHETRGEWRWTRAASHERLSRARRARSRVRQNRVVLTPGVCASSLAIARKATGAIVHRSPGRARHKPSNHCAGKAGCLAAPVCRCASVLRAFAHSGPWVPSRHQVFPAPSAQGGSRTEARLGRDAPRGCRGVSGCHCERSEAIQTASAERFLNCFAALAMTVERQSGIPRPSS